MFQFMHTKKYCKSNRETFLEFFFNYKAAQILAMQPPPFPRRLTALRMDTASLLSQTG